MTGGRSAGPLLGLLGAAETLYGWCVARRNRRYDRNGPQLVLTLPVISVGNLTTGGTGKTPFVIDLVSRLRRMGCHPAVVSRGYKAVPGQPNDEERLIRKRCPRVPCSSHADRGQAAVRAQRRFGADVIVLDDGFQHRRLGRRLDIVLVDATCPFGYGHLLPRGRLREPVDSLKRAHVVVITRSDQVPPPELTRIEADIRRAAVSATVLKCRHAVTSIERLDGTSVDDSLQGQRAVLFAGIGRPQAFATTARSLGVIVVGERWWPDHHRYRSRDIRSLLRADAFPPHDVLLTTEKDAVKLAELGDFDRADILVVTVAIDFPDESSTLLQSVLGRTLSV